jgi:hypothetical protein
MSKFFCNQAVLWQSFTVPSAGLCHWCWPPPCEKGRRLIDIHLCLPCFVGRRVAGQPAFACASPSHRISTGPPCCSSLPRVRIRGQVVHIVYTPLPKLSWPFRCRACCSSWRQMSAFMWVSQGDEQSLAPLRATPARLLALPAPLFSGPRALRCAISRAALRWQKW